jgi:histidine ammonia-lyase
MIKLDGKSLTIEKLYKIAGGERVEIDGETIKNLEKSREFVERLLSEDKPFYGINTGVGKLAEIKISGEDIEKLQVNIVRSHAVGVGTPLSIPDVRAIMALRLNTFLSGHSGVRLQVPETLLFFLNRGITPVVPERGSVGASGDLAPLAHIALALIGEGEVIYNGKRILAREAIEREGGKPLKLKAKEGIALINGTQASTAHLALTYKRSMVLFHSSLIVSLLTFEALNGIPSQFDPRLGDIRPHRGQKRVLSILWDALSGFPDERVESPGRVQDAYSLRCIPQVHGAVLDLLSQVESILFVELNSTTDNPVVFGEGEIISGGNFHGQIISFAGDILSMGLQTLSSISERRTFRLLTPELSGLSPFLANESGLNSGLMMLQVTQAALVSENKILSHPASSDSIPTSGDQEDFVSMSMGSALKARRVLENTEDVISIELFAAFQAINLRGLEGISPKLKKIYKLLEGVLKPVEGDRFYGEDIEIAKEIIRGGTLLNFAREAGILLS